MSFESGKVTFRKMHIAGNICADVADQIALRGMDLTQPKSATGWASWKSSIRPAKETEDVTCAGYIRANLSRCKPAVQAKYRKERIREALLREAEKSGFPVDKLGKVTRAEIRNTVDAALFDASTPSVRAMEFAYKKGDAWLAATCMTMKEEDFFVGLFREATGASLHAMTFAVWCSTQAINLPDFPAWNFLNDEPDEDGGSMADDFLTWLWAKGTEEGGSGVGGRGSEMQVTVDGPVTLHGECDNGPRMVSLRSGTPTLGRELVAALAGGKKITAAKLMLELNGEAFEGMIDHSLAFRSVTFPDDPKAMDEASVFQSRMVAIRRWTEAVYGMVGAFVECRRDEGAWAAFTAGMRSLLAGKSERGRLNDERKTNAGETTKHAKGAKGPDDAPKTSGARHELTIDMDAKCQKCGKPGATPSGVCLKCATKVLRGRKA